MTPSVVQGLALAWLAVITVVVVAAIPVGLIVIRAYQTWKAALDPKVASLVTGAAVHEVQLNGAMGARIAAGAHAQITSRAAALALPAVTTIDPVLASAAKASRMAALKAELAFLEPTA